jgi:hypothetical protein
MKEEFNKLNSIYNLKKQYKKVWKEKCNQYAKNPPSHIIKQIPKRIIVIGDLHGDYQKTIEIFRISKLIDLNNQWIGGDTIVVQLGDQIDRCRLDRGICTNIDATLNDEASDMKILYLMTELHNQAEKLGGAVYSIMGNHELMNVQGDFRYVSRKNILEFSKDGTINNGIKERENQFKPGNKIANFLACTRLMSLVIGPYLFVHAGIVPEIAKKYNVSDMNHILALYLFDNLDATEYQDLLIGNKSPMWNRTIGSLNINLDLEHKKNEAKEVCESLFDDEIQTNLFGNNHKIKRVFVGHTPQIYKGINSTCNNRVWYVDVGVSKAFDGYDNDLKYKGVLSENRKSQVIEILNNNGIETINIIK